MIRDRDTLAELRRGWASVKRAQSMVAANLAGASHGGGFITDEFRDTCYNLVLIYAFGLFNDVLTALANEGYFSCRSSHLKSLMAASRTALPWAAFDAVDAGRELRRQVAHNGATASRQACGDAIEAIERELVSWRILDGPVSVKVTISRTPIA